MALTVRAFAKLNLTFEVLGRRDDGYHEIRSVLQTIDLADELEFSPAAGLSVGVRRTGAFRNPEPGVARRHRLGRGSWCETQGVHPA